VTARPRSRPPRPPRAAIDAERALKTRPNLVVTGLSGAGHSSALKALEDMGFEAVDNLPLSLLGPLLARRGRARPPLAVGVDARARDFDPARLGTIMARLGKRSGAPLRLLFLDATDETLARRYRETRRKHPLGADRSIRDAIRRERMLLKPLRAAADEVVDTTDLAPPHLRRLLRVRFGSGTADMTLFVVSFAYRRGLPADADLVFDVRFLDNPHYHAALRPLTGRHSKVGAHVAKDPGFASFFQALTNLMAVLLPRFEEDGKSDVTIGIGCTGGRHRSVYVAEELARWFSARGRAVTVRHRDLDSDAELETTPIRREGRQSLRRGKAS
jgi:RNase adapter protein RapZ